MAAGATGQDVWEAIQEAADLLEAALHPELAGSGLPPSELAA